jgi:hypothetical protein
MVRDWQAALERAVKQAVAEGHLPADTDPMQTLFEIHGLILALHYENRFLHNPGSIDRALLAFESIVERYASAAARSPEPARP